MSNITVYNNMSLDMRSIKINNDWVEPGSSKSLSFEREESVRIAISRPGDILFNGCWIRFPHCCNHNFLPENPTDLSEITDNNIKKLYIPSHAPTWELTITNQSCQSEIFHAAPPSEPNITVGDNQN
jgi:hypothetical protein